MTLIGKIALLGLQTATIGVRIVSTNATTGTAHGRSERFPFALAVALVSIALGALYVFPSPYPNEPPVYGFLLFTLIFFAALYVCVWRMTLVLPISRWTALYVLTATVMIPALDGLVGMSNRHVFVPSYIVAVAAAYFIARAARRSR